MRVRRRAVPQDTPPPDPALLARERARLRALLLRGMKERAVRNPPEKRG